MLAKVRSEHGNALDAELLVMAVADDQSEILKALLNLGVDVEAE
jgi:hypothetical protein